MPQNKQPPGPSASHVTPFPKQPDPTPKESKPPSWPRVVSTDPRFVYDLIKTAAGYVVSFRGAALSRHHSLEEAETNARVIAGKGWSLGQRTLVRELLDDGSVRVLVSFG